MITPDIHGRLWHPGTRLGLICSAIAFVVFGVTMTQDPDGPYAWLANFGPVLVLVPVAATTHAYRSGQRGTGQTWITDDRQASLSGGDRRRSVGRRPLGFEGFASVPPET